jgi:hypothetical protein
LKQLFNNFSDPRKFPPSVLHGFARLLELVRDRVNLSMGDKVLELLSKHVDNVRQFQQQTNPQGAQNPGMLYPVRFASFPPSHTHTSETVSPF